jgi:hypothetical protein
MIHGVRKWETEKTERKRCTKLTVIEIERPIRQRPQEWVNRFEQLDPLVEQLPAE